MDTPLVFMGTPEFALPSLRRLAGEGYAIVAVYTQPDRPAGRGRRLRPPPAKLAAQELGLPVYQPRQVGAVAAELAGLRPQLIVVCAYGQILPPSVLAIPPRGTLNVHPSLLPRWRGASPIAAAILAGDQETGVTVMLMDPGMDTGPVLAQRRLPIEPQDSAGSLSARLAELGAELLAETLPRWLAGEITPQPQEPSQATRCPLLRKEEGAIDWRLPAASIWRQVRAFDPWPGAFTFYRGELLYIREAWPLPEQGEATPGTVLALTEAQPRPGPGPQPTRGPVFGVQTGQGVLAVLGVQRAGRRAMTAAEFLRGERGFVGTVLGGK